MPLRAPVVAVGEILWDLFPAGPQFGGAPANFAAHVAAHGFPSSLISAVGNDPLGDEALAVLERKQVDTRLVHRSLEYPTGQVQVKVDAAGKASFTFGDHEAWDYLPSDRRNETAVREASAICFGTLGQREPQSRNTIQTLLKLAPRSALRIFDINLRPPFYDLPLIVESLGLANVLKLNDDEMGYLQRELSLSHDVAEAGRELIDRFDLQMVAITLGDHGAWLIRQDDVFRNPGVQVAVKDTVGAGDSFTATLVVATLKGLPWEEVLDRACRVAAFVCTQEGATPQLPESERLT